MKNGKIQMKGNGEIQMKGYGEIQMKWKKIQMKWNGEIQMNEELDLVDEMEWEDSDKIEFISLEAAGLENLDYDTVPTIQRNNYYNQEN